MKEEIVSLALQTARNPKKTPEEAAYYAGCLQAAENLLNIVNNLELKLQGQATLEELGRKESNRPIRDASPHWENSFTTNRRLGRERNEL